MAGVESGTVDDGGDDESLPFGGRCTTGAEMAKKHSLKQRRQGSKSNTPSSERRQQPCTGHSIIAGTVFFSIVEELSSSPRPKPRSHQTSSSVHLRRIRPINSASRRHRTSHSQHHPGNHDEFERSWIQQYGRASLLHRCIGRASPRPQHQ